MRVGYHVHTCYSFDCSTSLEEVAASAISAGLDRIHVTDHDTLEGAQRLAEMRPTGLDVVVGCELSASDGSHVVGLGLREVVPTTSVLGLLEAIRAQGGQVLLPHPFRHRSGVFRNDTRRPAGFMEDVLELTDLVECFNLSDIYQANKSNFRFAVELGIAAVASSDAHTAGAIGSVYVEYADEAAADAAALSTMHRTLWFPDQRPAPDVTFIKQLFHRLPSPIQQAARVARKGAGLAPVPATAADARQQYELPTPADGEGHS